jgi:hypothetical protein
LLGKYFKTKSCANKLSNKKFKSISFFIFRVCKGKTIEHTKLTNDLIKQLKKCWNGYDEIAKFDKKIKQKKWNNKR